MIDNIEKSKCTGCKMCADICPRKAIDFREDIEGFWYPMVDTEKCVKCGLCREKCPSLNEYRADNTMPDVYAVWSKDDNVRITSTSGGAFWAIAKNFLEQGGVVAGCVYGDDWKSAKHILARYESELLKIKGSKYFQSDTSGIYKKTKEALLNGDKVLFCGTPCQNAALRTFLGREYPNLYCLDFICRSINSPKAFKAYIEELEEKHKSKVCEVQLKNKNSGWQSLASRVKFDNGDEEINDKTKDWWVKGFIYNDLYTRDSCYHCQYKVLPRASADITIGDFWGIENQKKSDMFKGISVIMINSEKGKRLFEESKNDFIVQKKTLEDVKPGNPALLINPIRTKKQDVFFELLKQEKFSVAVSKCIKESAVSRKKKKMKYVLKDIKRIIEMVLNSEISGTKYIYYNYLSKNIVRKDGAKIIPYKGTILDLHPTARIYLKGKDLLICTNKLKKSKAETHVRMNENAVWNCNNGAYLFYNTVLEIKPNAILESGYFSANGGSVIIAHKNIKLGEDVMIGRNVIIYDSDFHSLNNKEGIPCNPPKPVNIKDHVWLTTNIMVQKGVTIGEDSLITAYTVVNNDMPEHSIIGGKSVGEVIRDSVSWDRKTCPLK